jgi:hypothetical protein
MPSPQRAVTVTSTATRLIQKDPTNRPIWLHVNSNETVYIGDETVTIANGFPIVKHGSPLAGSLGPGADLWAICESGKSADVRIFTIPEDE